MSDNKEHTQRLAPDAERPHAALTQTDAPHALARDNLHATKQNKSRGRLLASNSTGMQKILCTGAAAVERGGSARSDCVPGGRGGARPARGCKGQGGAHLPVDDANVVLGATSFQGIS